MSTNHASNQPPSPQLNWTSIIQLVFSALAALFLLGVAALIAMTSSIQYFTQGSSSQELTQSFMIAASLAFAGVLVLPSAWYAWKSLSSTKSEPLIRQEPRGFGLILTLVVLCVVPGALWLGGWVAQKNQFAWFLLPLLNILVNGLSAFWLVYMGIRGLNPGSPKRRWGVFASGLILSPAIILTLELLALVGFAILTMIWLVLDSGTTTQLQSLIFRLQSTTPDPDAILRIVLPFLLRPGVLFIAFTFISVIVPLLEEALKPIGVWFMAGQKINPAEGFALGVLCGAGFGLFENLGNTSVGGETWVILASTRITTLLLHCLTTGMVGWALASAWSEKRYLRLGITYAFAVVVHGLWNGMAVLSAISSLEGQVDILLPANLQQIGDLAVVGVIILGVFNLVLFLGFNTVLRNSSYAKTALSTSEGEVPGLNPSGLIPMEQGESINQVTNSPSPLSSVETSSLPVIDGQSFSPIENPPTEPETKSWN
ncbi:MAG: hypothetical protein A2Z71_00730 [Chloroflexi bacterium RBG_13_50_21]|nr:MAG: hypothetical protein A2Z71_00730 [Chloroflexi bacterium RBG_13_50_21]